MSDLSTVYDLFYPSPINLREIAAIKVAIEFWRQEIRQHRANNKLKKLKFGKISSREFNPLVPSSLLSIIDKHIELFGLSIDRWSKYHSMNKFFSSGVLRNFDDFVGDFDGSVHYRRTAEQMIRCEGISANEKFKIACLYCLENDIAQLWSSVSSQFDLNDIDFDSHPQLFYWICRLKNQLYKIPIFHHFEDNYDENVEVNLIRSIALTSHWPSLEYFFVRITDSTKRFHFINTLIMSLIPREFYRYVLVRLNDQEFDQIFVARSYMLGVLSRFSDVVFEKIWMYLKHKVKKDSFVTLLREILKNNNATKLVSIDPASLKIWNSAPDHFKQSAIQHILLNTSLLREIITEISIERKSFLFAALSDASYENRFAFWNMHCCDLIGLMKIEELHQLMALCFKDKSDIIQYRETVMSQYEKIGAYCLNILNEGNFEKLDKILRFCCEGEESIRNIQLRLLHEEFTITAIMSQKKANMLNNFINDAFVDVDRATEFKNQLLLRPLILQELPKGPDKEKWLEGI